MKKFINLLEHNKHENVYDSVIVVFAITSYILHYHMSDGSVKSEKKVNSKSF